MPSGGGDAETSAAGMTAARPFALSVSACSTCSTPASVPAMARSCASPAVATSSTVPHAVTRWRASSVGKSSWQDFGPGADASSSGVRPRTMRAVPSAVVWSSAVQNALVPSAVARRWPPPSRSARGRHRAGGGIDDQERRRRRRERAREDEDAARGVEGQLGGGRRHVNHGAHGAAREVDERDHAVVAHGEVRLGGGDGEREGQPRDADARRGAGVGVQQIDRVLALGPQHDEPARAAVGGGRDRVGEIEPGGPGHAHVRRAGGRGGTLARS